jgi:hypothetical protein
MSEQEQDDGISGQGARQRKSAGGLRGVQGAAPDV